MQQPREKMDDLPPLFDEEDISGEALTDDDEGNLRYLNYDPEHKTTALFLIGALDSGIGLVGTLVTGLAPERYQAFTDRTPPDFYVDAAAALVKKYQAKLSLEAMLITALVMVYAPSAQQMLKDRKATARVREQERRQQELEAMSAALEKSQHARSHAETKS
jgi:hypothetical protein